jgi:hypothetical protein
VDEEGPDAYPEKFRKDFAGTQHLKWVLSQVRVANSGGSGEKREGAERAGKEREEQEGIAGRAREGRAKRAKEGNCCSTPNALISVSTGV